MDTETTPAEGSADRDETPGEHDASSQADGHAPDEKPTDEAAAEGEANSDR